MGQFGTKTTYIFNFIIFKRDNLWFSVINQFPVWSIQHYKNSLTQLPRAHSVTFKCVVLSEQSKAFRYSVYCGVKQKI